MRNSGNYEQGSYGPQLKQTETINRKNTQFQRRQQQGCHSNNKKQTLPAPNLYRETHQQITKTPLTNYGQIAQPENNTKTLTQRRKECKYWNQQRCTKQDCQYQHYSMKYLCSESNPLLSQIQENQLIEEQKLLLIELTQKCYLTKEQLSNYWRAALRLCQRRHYCYRYNKQKTYLINQGVNQKRDVKP